MNKWFLCLSAGLLLGIPATLKAQYSIHHTPRVAQPLVHEYAQHHYYIGLSALEVQRPLDLVSGEDAHYISILSEYVRRGESATYILDDFLSKEVQSIDLQRARLLLGIAYYEQGQHADALAQLNSIEEKGLYHYECDKANLLRAYLYLQGEQTDKPQFDKALALIKSAKQGKSIWAEQARLYEANIVWSKGRSDEAMKLLETGEWSEEIMPEVEYTGALIACSRSNAESALKVTEQLVAKYPEMGRRPRLLGAKASVLSRLGRYDEAIRILEPLANNDTLLEEENYTLGMAYYKMKRYDDAIAPLKKATKGNGTLAAYSSFALGNIYRYKGDPMSAQLAFEQALRASDDSGLIEEEARYQLIELGYAGGQDAFGGQVKRIEQFLNDFPKGKYEVKVLSLLSGYINRSTDYESACKLIDRLGKKGINLSGLKQTTLVRWAESVGREHNSYLPLLTEAIALGEQNKVAYKSAILMRAETLLGLGRFAQAERDAALLKNDAEEGAKANYLLGYALYNQKKYQEALIALKKVQGSSISKNIESDALVRIGDCLSQTGQSNDASVAYRKADDIREGGNEEALYRLAMLYSRLGKHSEQIAVVKSIESKYPSSPYRAELLYRRGRSELLLGKTNEALKTLTDVQRLYPASEYAPTALLEKALLEGNQDKEEASISTYKQLISLYPDSSEAENALSDMKAIYSERNALDEYASYVRSLGRKIGKQPEDEAHLSFISIESKVRRGEQGTTALLERYLQDYPKSADRLSAQRLLIKQYLNEGRSLDALKHLSEARAVAKGEDAIALALEEGDLYKTLGRTTDAYNSYQSAYKAAEGTKVYSLTAGMKLLRLSESKNVAGDLSVANALLSRSDLTEEQRAELTLLKGKLYQRAGQTREALESYAKLKKMTNSVYGAEAIVLYADLLMKSGRPAEVEPWLKGFVSSGTSQTYWLARAFLSLADSYEAQGDIYMSKQYVESLQDNYTGEEADIKDMISARLKRYNK